MKPFVRGTDKDRWEVKVDRDAIRGPGCQAPGPHSDNMAGKRKRDAGWRPVLFDSKTKLQASLLGSEVTNYRKLENFVAIGLYDAHDPSHKKPDPDNQVDGDNDQGQRARHSEDQAQNHQADPHHDPGPAQKDVLQRIELDELVLIVGGGDQKNDRRNEGYVSQRAGYVLRHSAAGIGRGRSGCASTDRNGFVTRRAGSGGIIHLRAAGRAKTGHGKASTGTFAGLLTSKVGRDSSGTDCSTVLGKCAMQQSTQKQQLRRGSNVRERLRGSP